MSFSSEQVANWLTLHPEFFNEHSQLLTQLSIPHPHGSHAVSLSERQLIAFREKNKVLESKLNELLRFAKENDDIIQKIHHFSCDLMIQQHLSGVLASTYQTLIEHFQVPGVTMRLWGIAHQEPKTNDKMEFHPIDDSIKQFIDELTEPLCGTELPQGIQAWLTADETLRSFALLPLKQDQTFGALLLASQDEERFYNGMGTLYLERLANLIAGAIHRHSHGQ